MSDGLRPIKRALISVSDKNGLIDFARKLAARSVALVSTGGAAQALSEAGLDVADVASVTGFPEMLDGRVKTLHPAIHGGILARRDMPAHLDAIKAHNIAPIDLVVVNFYPFAQTRARGGDFDECLENIDIGGPALIRAAAKNHDGVTVVTDSSDYAAVLARWRRMTARRLWCCAASSPVSPLRAPRLTTPRSPPGSPSLKASNSRRSSPSPAR